VVPSDTMLRKGFAFVTAFTIITIIIIKKRLGDRVLIRIKAFVISFIKAFIVVFIMVSGFHYCISNLSEIS